MGSFCLIWNDLIFAPSIGFGYGIELQKKISVYANMDVFIHLTTADFLKKKKKKKKRIGSPFAFYFNKVLYRFARWVISTTHKLKITITHLLTKQRIYVMIHRLRTFGFWMKRDQFCLILLLLVNLRSSICVWPGSGKKFILKGFQLFYLIFFSAMALLKTCFSRAFLFSFCHSQAS